MHLPQAHKCQWTFQIPEILRLLRRNRVLVKAHQINGQTFHQPQHQVYRTCTSQNSSWLCSRSPQFMMFVSIWWLWGQWHLWKFLTHMNYVYQYERECSESITLYIYAWRFWLCQHYRAAALIWYSFPALCFLNLLGECRNEKVRCLRKAKPFYHQRSSFLSNILKTSCAISVVIQALAFAK